MGVGNGSRPKNNFDCLRLIAAFLVLYGHANQFLRINGGHYAINVGLGIFFTISGFLVTQSWFNRSSSLRYAAGRCLRIFPGLTLAVLIDCFLLGPIISSLSFKDYFTNGMTYADLKNILLINDLLLPGVFANVSNSAIVNGVFWTLPVEVGLYAMVFLLGSFFGKKKRGGMISLGATILLCFMFIDNAKAAWFFVILMFLSGSLMFIVFKDGVSVKPGIVIPATLISGLGIYYDYYYAVFPVFAYAILAGAFIKIPVLADAGKFGDFSYGIYLYHYPILKTLLMMHNNFTLAPLTAAGAALSLIMASVSWHLVEKPALDMKKRF